MKSRLLKVCALALFILPLSVAGQEARPVSDPLFLAPDDIKTAERVLPALVEASRKGKNETRMFLSRQDVAFRQLTQVLSNISVAYSSIVFDEWMKELQSQMAGAKYGEYTKLVEQARRQIDEITSRHAKATRGGRSALAVNKEIVASNRAAVEEIILMLKEVAAENLPQDKTAER